MTPDRYNALIEKRDRLLKEVSEINDELKFSNYRCLDCKFMNQGKNSAQCFNPKQTNDSLNGYVYWGTSCGFFEKGNRLAQEQMTKNGFKKITDPSAAIKEYYISE